MGNSVKIDYFDWLFNEFAVELGVLDEYLKLVEQDLTGIVADRKRRVLESYDYEDEAEFEEALYLHEFFEEGVITRYVTGSVVIACWATYESAVQMMAKELARRRGISIQISDLRGGFLEKSKKYFRDVLDIRLNSQDDESKLKRISELRHALVHANGLLEHVREPMAKHLRDFIEANPSLDLYGGWIIVSAEFSRDALKFMERVLRDSLERVKST